MPAEARPAGRRAESRAGVDEYLDQPFLQSVQVDLLRAGDNDAAHPGMYFLALQNLGRHPQVLDAAVGAAPDDRLVDFNFADLADRLGVGRQNAAATPAARFSRHRIR